MNTVHHLAQKWSDRSYVYSWLRVVMTWSVVLRSPRPMKLQEMVCGFG